MLITWQRLDRHGPASVKIVSKHRELGCKQPDSRMTLKNVKKRGNMISPAASSTCYLLYNEVCHKLIKANTTSSFAVKRRESAQSMRGRVNATDWRPNHSSVVSRVTGTKTSDRRERKSERI